jgi:hypothetical protein
MNLQDLDLYTILDPIKPVVGGLMGLTGSILNAIPLMDLFNNTVILPLLLILQPAVHLITDLVLSIL